MAAGESANFQSVSSSVSLPTSRSASVGGEGGGGGGRGGGGGESLLVSQSLFVRARGELKGFSFLRGFGFEGGSGFEEGRVVLSGLEGRQKLPEAAATELFERGGGFREKDMAEEGWHLAAKRAEEEKGGGVVLVGMEKCDVESEKGSIIVYGIWLSGRSASHNQSLSTSTFFCALQQ